MVSARRAQNLAGPWSGGTAGGDPRWVSWTGESEGVVPMWGRGKDEHGGARLTRKERKALRRRAAEDAELAARVQRAQRRLAQATGPLPVIDPRTPPDGIAAPARRSEIVEH